MKTSSIRVFTLHTICAFGECMQMINNMLWMRCCYSIVCKQQSHKPFQYFPAHTIKKFNYDAVSAGYMKWHSKRGNLGGMMFSKCASDLQCIPRNMYPVHAFLCFIVVWFQSICHILQGYITCLGATIRLINVSKAPQKKIGWIDHRNPLTITIKCNRT